LDTRQPRTLYIGDSRERGGADSSGVMRLLTVCAVDAELVEAGTSVRERLDKLESMRDISVAEGEAALSRLLERFKSVFDGDLRTGIVGVTPVSIRLKEGAQGKKVHRPARRWQPWARDVLRKDLDFKLQMGIVEKSRSAWNIQQVLVPKGGTKQPAGKAGQGGVAQSWAPLHPSHIVCVGRFRP
jgi:hypothetical protein